MGNRLKCHTTPKSTVGHGGANTPSNRCHTTTTPKGGWGGGEAVTPVSREVGQKFLITEWKLCTSMVVRRRRDDHRPIRVPVLSPDVMRGREAPRVGSSRRFQIGLAVHARSQGAAW